MEILAKVEPIPESVVWVIAIPYFILIHVGMLAFIINLVANILRRQYRQTFMLSWLRIGCSLYGSGVGYSLPIMGYNMRGNPLTPFLANLPALAFIGTIYPRNHIWIYLLYVFFGMLGGWGLGQLIEGITKKIRKNREAGATLD